jgi:hypothetical protein
MRKNLVVSVKFGFLVLVGMLFFSGCQSFSVRSQTEARVAPTPTGKDMKKDKKLESLKDLQWEKRIILVRENDDDAGRQLRDAVDTINERDVVWFRLRNGKIETNYEGELAEDLFDKLTTIYFEKFDANVFLIGKDGTVKSKDDKLDLTNYFGLIDSMPMRQQEMRQN